MDNQQHNAENRFADAGLALLMDWSAESDGELLWEEFSAEKHVMPTELDNLCNSQIRQTIKRQRNRLMLNRILKSAGKAAACFVLILCMTVSLITSVEALRVPVLNFLLKHSPRATTILFQHSATQSQTQLEELLCILKSNTPENYELIMEKVYRDEFSDPPVITSVFLAFQDAEEDNLMIQVAQAEGSWNIDTEGAAMTPMTLEDQKAILIERGSEMRLLWINDVQGLLFDVFAGSMEKSDFLDYVTTLAKEIRYSNAGFNE